MSLTVRTYSEKAEDFGKKLKALMREREFSISSLAEALAISRPTLANVVSGRVEPKFDLLKMLANELNIEIIIEPDNRKQRCRKLKI